MKPKPFHSGEQAARATRRGLGIDLPLPLADLLDVVEELVGVPVLIDRLGNEKVAGVLLRPGHPEATGGYDAFIAINADHQPVRQRFTLAHELGHVRMGHQPRVERTTDLFGSRTRDPQEVEANYFAAELLAPRDAVVEWLNRHRLVEQADQAESVVRFALRFGISFPAACFRFERAGAISSRAKRRLLAELEDDGSKLAQIHASDRLDDTIERLCGDEAYPRVPRQTASFARRARAAGLLDDEEFRALVPHQSDLDFDAADWMT